MVHLLCGGTVAATTEGFLRSNKAEKGRICDKLVNQLCREKNHIICELAKTGIEKNKAYKFIHLDTPRLPSLRQSAEFCS